MWKNTQPVKFNRLTSDLQRVTDASGNPLKFEMGFFGSCMGVLLCKRGENDPHVSFIPVVEDDGLWFVSRHPRFSSHWLPEMIEVLETAQRWMKNNCTRDPNGHGWSFKTSGDGNA